MASGDVLIQVAARRDYPGYEQWTCKQGRWHVRPPLDVLQSMTAYRIHLTDCQADGGPLLVLPHSHQRKLHEDLALTGFDDRDAVAITCEVGSILAFSPPLLHASRPVSNNSPRDHPARGV